MTVIPALVARCSIFCLFSGVILAVMIAVFFCISLLSPLQGQGVPGLRPGECGTAYSRTRCLPHRNGGRSPVPAPRTVSPKWVVFGGVAHKRRTWPISPVVGTSSPQPQNAAQTVSYGRTGASVAPCPRRQGGNPLNTLPPYPLEQDLVSARTSGHCAE